jgi:putative DNA primase/helicase
MTGSGLVDLRTGERLPPETEDYGLYWTPVPYEPEAPCPRWKTFVHEVMDEESAMEDFLQRLSGYAATGYSREQSMFFFGRTPNSGKGTFLRVLKRALRDYAIGLNIDFLNKKQYVGHPTDIWQLFGVRLGIISELAAGDKLNEQRLKVLTGGDPLRARGIAQDFMGFEPTHTLILQTNHYPVIESQDEGTWRRIWVVPWTKASVMPERQQLMPDLPVADPDLEPALEQELPGILAWIIRGAVTYFERGLAIPPTVKEATLAYREEQDALTPFRLACIGPAPRGTRLGVSDAYAAYCRFQAARNEPAMSQAEFGRRMKMHYTVRHFQEGNFYLDIALKDLKEGEQDS